MWTFPEKLKSIRKSKGYDQDSLGKKIGKSRGAFSNYERGEALPTLKDFLSLCEILEITPNDLLLDNDEISHVKENGAVYRRVQSNVHRYLNNEVIENMDDYLIEHWPILPNRTPSGNMWVVFRLESPAMEPKISSGAWLCCDPTSSFRDDYLYMCQFADGSLRCALMRKNRNRDSDHYGLIQLLSYNSLHRPQLISESEISAMWRVVRAYEEQQL